MGLAVYNRPPVVATGQGIPTRVYVVDGGTYARTRAGIAAAVAALVAAGGNGEVLISPGADITWDHTTITISTDGVSIGSWGEGCNILMPADGTPVIPFAVTGAASTSTLLTANGNLYDRSFTVTSAAGFSVDDLIYVYSVDGLRAFGQVMRLHAISSLTFTISDQLAETFETADTATCYRVVPIKRVKFHHMNFDCNGNSGAGTYPISMTYTEQCELSNLRFKGFGVVDQQGGPQSTVSYRNTYRDIDLVKCGTASAHSFADHWASHSNVVNIRCDQSPGFGPGFNYNHFANHVNVSVSHAQGRSYSFSFSSFNNVANPVTIAPEASPSAYTGLSLRLYTHHTFITNGIGFGNAGGDLYVIGDDNQINGGHYQFIYIDGSPSPARTRLNCTYDTLTDAGSGTVEATYA